MTKSNSVPMTTSGPAAAKNLLPIEVIVTLHLILVIVWLCGDFLLLARTFGISDKVALPARAWIETTEGQLIYSNLVGGPR